MADYSKIEAALNRTADEKLQKKIDLYVERFGEFMINVLRREFKDKAFNIYEACVVIRKNYSNLSSNAPLYTKRLLEVSEEVDRFGAVYKIGPQIFHLEDTKSCG